jgi:hypothetical protein
MRQCTPGVALAALFDTSTEVRRASRPCTCLRLEPMELEGQTEYLYEAPPDHSVATRDAAAVRPRRRPHGYAQTPPPSVGGPVDAGFQCSRLPRGYGGVYGYGTGWSLGSIDPGGLSQLAGDALCYQIANNLTCGAQRQDWSGNCGHRDGTSHSVA